MSKLADSKPHGFTKDCRDCKKPIYLHRGSSGPWRAYDPVDMSVVDTAAWTRHRCPAALQDADLMAILSPAGSKAADLVPRLKTFRKDLDTILKQAEDFADAANAARESAANAANAAKQ